MTLRTLLLLTALALPFAAVAADAPASSLPAAVTQPAPLTLHDLLVAAMNHNLELQAKRLEPKTAAARVEGAKGSFDPVLAAGGNYGSTENTQNQRDFLATGSSARVYDEKNNRYELGISGK